MVHRLKYFDRESNMISLEQYCGLSQDSKYVSVAYSEDTNKKIRISTVWLGLNHNLKDESPEIFETFVFCHDKVINTKRYANENEALEGHKQLESRYISASI